jgi:type I restriction enzyme S subunit
MLVHIPSNEILKKFNEIVYPLLEKIRDSYFENNYLITIKDSLLPRLMSGKIRVKVVSGKIKSKKTEVKEKPVLSPIQRKDLFKDAILISNLIAELATDQYPLSRYRYTKHSYFVKRELRQDIFTDYPKMPGGPYSHANRYKGPEKIMQGRKYVIPKGPGFIAGPKIQEAKNWASKYRINGAISKVKNYLKYKTNDELETLSTLDYLILELKKKGIDNFSPKILIDTLGSTPEWKHKLEQNNFSEESIKNGLIELKKFGLSYK